MAFTTATSAQAVSVRNAALTLTKSLDLAVSAGPMLTYGTKVDTASYTLLYALKAAGTDTGKATVLITDTAVNVPITFNTARTAGSTATAVLTWGISGGVITNITIA